jgi:WXG100 family type VII secretion target
MAKAAGQIDHAASTIAGLQKSLSGHHDAVLAGWQGQAADAFNTAFVEFNTAMSKILHGGDGKDGLDQIHEKLVHNRIQYESTEQEQTDASNSIHQFINQ